MKEQTYVLQQDFGMLGPKGTEVTFRKDGSMFINIPDALHQAYREKMGTTKEKHKGYWEEGCCCCGHGRQWHKAYTSEYSNWFTPIVRPEDILALKEKINDPTWLLPL